MAEEKAERLGQQILYSNLDDLKMPNKMEEVADIYINSIKAKL